MKKRILCLCLAAGLALTALAGCNTPEKPEPTQPAVLADASLLYGQTVTLTPKNLTGEITWSVDDPQRASVDENGVVTALASRGSVTVTAQNGDQTETFTVSLAEQTEFGAVSLPSVNDGLVIGVWNGSYHDIDDFRMELLADAGISLLIGLEDRWLASQTMEELLDIAQSYGISVIEDMRDWDGTTVPEFTNHPALAGYLLYDEPNTTEYDRLAQLHQSFRQAMPEDKLFYVNLFPMACAYESLYSQDYNPLKVDYEKHYITPFVEAMDLPYISYDAYALQQDDLIRPSYYLNFDIAAHAAQAQGREFWYTLLTSEHSTTDGRYICPGEEELRWQMALGMTYGSADLAHYVLCSHEQDYFSMIEYGTWEPTQIYNAVHTANNEFLAWDDIYTAFTWKGTAAVDVGQRNQMLRDLKHDVALTGPVSDISSDQDLLVGIFDHKGQTAYMITNAGDTTAISGISHQMTFAMNDANAVLTVEGDYSCVAVISYGQITYLPITDGTVRLPVDAYNGVFVIPVAK